VDVAAGSFEDTSGNDGAQLTFSFRLADTVAPTLASSSPTDGEADVAKTADIVLTFVERVLPATGNVVLAPQTSGSSVTIAITDTTQVTFVNSVVNINPASDLVPSQSGQVYTVTVGSGVMTDAGRAADFF
jgi:hypothetical protein